MREVESAFRNQGNDSTLPRFSRALAYSYRQIQMMDSLSYDIGSTICNGHLYAVDWSVAIFLRLETHSLFSLGRARRTGLFLREPFSSLFLHVLLSSSLKTTRLNLIYSLILYYVGRRSSGDGGGNAEVYSSSLGLRVAICELNVTALKSTRTLCTGRRLIGWKD